MEHLTIIFDATEGGWWGREDDSIPVFGNGYDTLIGAYPDLRQCGDGYHAFVNLEGLVYMPYRKLINISVRCII